MRIYLAGPMRGYPEYNFPAFDDHARRLRNAGYTVWSPADHDRGQGFDEKTDEAGELKDYMKVDLVEVLCSDAVAVLDGWTESQGARLEVHVARECGIPVYFAEDLEVTPIEECSEVWPAYRRYWAEVAADIKPKPALEEATDLIHGDRQTSYGHPIEDFTRIVGMVNAAFADKLAVPFEPEDWPLIMQFVKISRERNAHKRDNIVDGAGYWGTLDLIHERLGGGE